MTITNRVQNLEDWRQVAEPQINKNTQDIENLNKIILVQLKSINEKLSKPNKFQDIFNKVSYIISGGFIFVVFSSIFL